MIERCIQGGIAGVGTIVGALVGRPACRDAGTAPRGILPPVVGRRRGGGHGCEFDYDYYVELAARVRRSA